MKRVLATLLVLLVMMTGSYADAETWYIDGKTSDRVHLRAEPDGESLGLYFQGTPVQYEQTYFDTDWAYVLIGTEEGYVDRDYLTREQPENRNPAYCVNNRDSSWVNLRSRPTTQSESLGRYNNGTEVVVLGETRNGWFYVSVGDKNGYMLGELLSPVQEEAQTSQPTEVVGQAGDGWLIHAYEADNGQMLYFTALESEVNILYEDVNFDGHQDLVIYTSLGASNAYCEFFVWSNGQYVMADHPAIGYGLCNYQLHPEMGRNMVSTHANNGSAGAEHEDCVFRWEGTRLKLIRRAVGELRTECTSDVETTTKTTWHNQLHITIRDYTVDRYEGTLIYEKTTELNDEIGRELEIEGQRFWEGI